MRARGLCALSTTQTKLTSCNALQRCASTSSCSARCGADLYMPNSWLPRAHGKALTWQHASHSQLASCQASSTPPQQLCTGHHTRTGLCLPSGPAVSGAHHLGAAVRLQPQGPRLAVGARRAVLCHAGLHRLRGCGCPAQVRWGAVTPCQATKLICLAPLSCSP